MPKRSQPRGVRIAQHRRRSTLPAHSAALRPGQFGWLSAFHAEYADSIAVTSAFLSKSLSPIRCATWQFSLVQ